MMLLFSSKRPAFFLRARRLNGVVREQCAHVVFVEKWLHFFSQER